MYYGPTHIPNNINLNLPGISPGVFKTHDDAQIQYNFPRSIRYQGIFLEEIANEMSIINQFAGLFAGPTPRR